MLWKKLCGIYFLEIHITPECVITHIYNTSVINAECEDIIAVLTCGEESLYTNTKMRTDL